MRSFSFVFLILCFLISGCSGGTQIDRSMRYDFTEPYKFPFEVNDVRTEIAIDNPDYLQQYVFHYKNKQTKQEINYILSKVIGNPEEASKQSNHPVKLKNGKQAYYKEDDTSQFIFWDSENGFLARFVYYIDGNTERLGSNKLAQSDLIDLINQVQQ
ncbi:hypothetical protein [Paenibacillus sp. XY044]|uniref:hypothetical protein n=1 Tax=Paenibacillus sp. XY044 TaxID=2026089 RepID=UPI000B998022|nr:hypothetical protein [Paenibacillus sp. XY044]OZB94088.1 hypothetical protein CJP46_17885 [Paenibacillus sp. XY044]